MPSSSAGWKKLWVLAAVVVVLAVGLVGVQSYMRASAEARARQSCFANQITIERAAKAYVDAGPQYSMSQIDGPVDANSPLMWKNSPKGQLLAVPRCPDLPHEYYVLRDGVVSCPLHGHYR